MKVSLISVTPKAEENIVYIARVSSKREDKKSKPEGLLNYLIKHKHWSPFEHSHLSVEIETSKAIGIQLIRHRSFTFQEFSQRYQNVSLLGEMFEEIELRKQCEDNRQSSTEVHTASSKAQRFNTLLIRNKKNVSRVIRRWCSERNSKNDFTVMY